MAIPLRMIGIETVGIDGDPDLCPIEIRSFQCLLRFRRILFMFDLALKYFEIARDVCYAKMPDLECGGGMIGVDCPFGTC
jgi:hypothetical protein